MQDIEFTIENGKLYMLQCRNGKRTGFAGVRIAVEMVDEKLISKEEALRRVEPEALNQLLRPVFLPAAKKTAIEEGRLLAKGLPAGPGAATGKVVFFADEAEALAAKGETSLILCRHETSPEDIRGMNAVARLHDRVRRHDLATRRWSRGRWARSAIVGCDALVVRLPRAHDDGDDRQGPRSSCRKATGSRSTASRARSSTAASTRRRPRSIRSSSRRPATPRTRRSTSSYAKLMSWADAARRLRVRANADQPDQAEAAVAFGAEGIGLCRTEHMFFGEGKIGPMREMIVAENEADRRAALAKLLPLQREDFAGIFQAMDGTAGHHPHHRSAAARVPAARRARACASWPRRPASRSRRSSARIDELHESNPMLGHRGCRLGITYPEITEMQARAIFEAAVDVASEGHRGRCPEIMIPLVGTKKELDHQATIVRKAAERGVRGSAARRSSTASAR